MLQWAVGCAPKAQPSAAPVGEANPPAAPLWFDSDACAERLHDLEGAFLLYDTRTGRLPDALADLPALPGVDPTTLLNCPVSGQPYVYVPQGIQLPEKRQRLIVYDATPAHAGYRWAIRVDEPRPGAALVFRVVAVPESAFLLRR